MPTFLGLDLGSTKTHALLVDPSGRALGFGEGGSANHEVVGYDGMLESMNHAMEEALRASSLRKNDIAGAGFGVAGYDWPSEYTSTESTIMRLGLNAPIKFVNDATLGIVAGAQEGWGIAVVSGTGCNCRGWDREHKREGRVTGHGVLMGEGAGAAELVFRAMQAINHSWIKRTPHTKLAEVFAERVGAKDMEDLVRGYTAGEYLVGAEAAPLIFRVAGDGDDVARELIHWAGCELGELANAVIRQLEFEKLTFDVVMTGSMFEGGTLLIEPMRETILKLAPLAHLVRLRVPPVLGAAILGMEAGNIRATPSIRKKMAETISSPEILL